jgi:putative toxin-antitoxin system antitoxin component (TIGR02293 family)
LPTEPEPIAEDQRLTLLDEAAANAESTPDIGDLGSSFDAVIFDRAIKILGGRENLGQVSSEFDLLESVQRGFPIAAVECLRAEGFASQVLEEVIAPKRTLARRRKENQRLTVAESDASWRLAHSLSLAESVLAGKKQALAWLSRPKPSLGGRKPTDLLTTAIGATRVEALLHQLEWGNT